MRAYDAQRLKTALRAVAPPLLFGFRLWASVCLALYVAFWLELDNAFWAGYTAVTVSQPRLGASLRKGWFRMVGTVVGAAAVVALTAWFPQDRGPFLIGLALWGAGCTLVATLLKNFAAYAAALAVMSMPRAAASFLTNCLDSSKGRLGRRLSLNWPRTRAKACGSISRLACVACGAED